MRALLLAIAVTGCAVPRAVADDRDELAAYTAGRTAGEPQRCVPIINSSDGLRAVDRRTVVYRSGDTNWVNRLEHDCPGLRPLATLIVEPIGNRYCRGDHVRALEAGGAPRPVCVLGSFTPYRPRD